MRRRGRGRRESSQRRRQLLANMSHEIRIADESGVLGYRILTSADDRPDLKSNWNLWSGNEWRADAAGPGIDDILDLFKIEAENHPENLSCQPGRHRSTRKSTEALTSGGRKQRTSLSTADAPRRRGPRHCCAATERRLSAKC